MSVSEGLRHLTVRCPYCSKRNTVEFRERSPHPTCPDCSRPLPLDEPFPVEGRDFTETVLDSEVPVLVDFHAEWCGPCRWLTPILADLARRWKGRVLTVKVDADEAPEVAERYGVTSLPTVILFQKGVEAGRSLGVEPEVLDHLLEDVA